MTVKYPECDHKNPDDTFYCGQCATLLNPRFKKLMERVKLEWENFEI